MSLSNPLYVVDTIAVLHFQLKKLGLNKEIYPKPYKLDTKSNTTGARTDY